MAALFLWKEFWNKYLQEKYKHIFSILYILNLITFICELT